MSSNLVGPAPTVSPTSKAPCRGAVIAALLASVASPVFAQAAPDKPVQLAMADAAATSAEAQPLDEIVVTATKRETNLQETPIAISVLNTQALADRHTLSLIDLGDGSIPSLRVATFEARNSALTVGIRGIVPFDANQTARDQGVGVYIDGIYLGRQQGLNSSLLDIERIEVLKGPQGTLFGRNTEGGALNIVTRAPIGELGLRATAGVGNYGSYDATVHLDLPAFANLAFKFDGLIQHQGATVENPLAGQYGWNYHNVVGGRAAARWKPVDGLTVDVAYDRTRDENTPNYSQLVNFNPLGKTVGIYDPTTGRLVAPGSAPGAAACAAATCIAPLSPLVVVSGNKRMKLADIGVPQQPSVDMTSGVSGNLRYKLSPSLELRSITAWRTVSTHQWDNSGGAHRTVFTPYIPGVTTSATAGYFSRYSLSELFQHQFSQELQAVGTLPTIDYVVGAYYFNEHVEEAAATPSSNRWNATGTSYTINSANAIGTISSSNQGWDRGSWYVARHSSARARSYALFGQGTWTPAGFDAFHLTAGARYTKDKREGLLDYVNGKAAAFTFSYDKGRVDPMVTAAFDISNDVHVYAKYSTGFRAGGANDRSQTFTSFGPESVKAFEIGAKTDFFDHHARLNVAVYRMDRRGTQTDFDNVDTNPNSPTFNLHTEETRNALGTSKIKGLEAELTVRPVDHLTLSGSYAYTDVKVPPIANPFLVGNPLFQVFTVYTPRHAASGSLDYDLPVGFADASLRFHLDGNYASRQYSFQAENIQADASFVVNGRVSLADIRVGAQSSVSISLWARNLLDETHIYRISGANGSTATLSASVLGDYANFNPPRTFGVEAAFKL